MTRKERNELADKFVEAAESVFLGWQYLSCLALMVYDVSFEKSERYGYLLSPTKDYRGGYWLKDAFVKHKEKRKWRVQALLLASEMIRQGGFEK